MNLSCSILGGNKGRPKGDFGRNTKFLVGTPRLSLAVWAAWNSTGPVRGPTIGGSPTPRFLLYGAVGCSRYGNMGGRRDRYEGKGGPHGELDKVKCA